MPIPAFLPAPELSQTWHEPESYRQFQCVGDACEDTCCDGWGIGVDRETYALYQQSGHPTLGPKLQKLVTISGTTSNNAFATITLDGSRCPFLEKTSAAFTPKQARSN